MALRLKALRSRAGLTQQALATEAGLSISLITALEYGIRDDPKLSTLLALAKALGCTMDELTWGLEIPSTEAKRKRKEGRK
jgi:transcriptional regulator with XRE-family HTH domain